MRNMVLNKGKTPVTESSGETIECELLYMLVEDVGNPRCESNAFLLGESCCAK